MENIKILSAEEFLKNHKKQNQEQIWDSISDLWNEFRKQPFDAVKEFLEGKKGKIIDLGCGNARNMIANSEIEYYGADFSKNQIECAEKLVKDRGINANLFRMNVDKLDSKIFKNEMFDYGLFIATLHCIEDKKERENALREFYRVLKKNGEGLISVWNSSDARFNGMKGDIYMSWKRDGKYRYRYYYLYSRNEFLDLLKGVGFQIIEISDKISDRFSKKNWVVRVKK